MFKLDKNKNYFTISLYVCAVLAITIIGVTICVFLPSIVRAIGSFIRYLSPVFLGLALAYFINPILNFVEKKMMKYVDRKKRTPYIKRIICLVITYIILSCIFVLFGLLIFPQIIQNFDAISHNLTTNITTLFQSVKTYLQDTFNINIGDMSQTIDGLSNVIIKNLTTFSSSIGRGIINFVLGLILSFFILAHNEKLRRGVKKMMAAFLPARAFNGIMKTTSMAHHVFGQFFVGKIFASLIVGLITLATLGFMNLPFMPDAFHVPYYLLVSAIVCITNIVPYVGPFLGALPCLLLVLVDGEGGLTKAIILLIVIVAVQIFDGNFLSPKILGKTIGISSLWVIVSIIVMGSFMGMIGMLIAVPVFTIFYNLVRDFTNKRLEKKKLPTQIDHYTPGEEAPVTPIEAWEANNVPQPHPDLLSDTDEGYMEALTRRPIHPDRGDKGGDEQ